MRRSKTLDKQTVLLAAVGVFAFLAVNFQIAAAADSGCVTCHLDQEMLKQNISAAKGQKSAMQSGAG
jgi:hypothetical protein